MLQEWFDAATGPGPFDIVVTGVAGRDGSDLGQALRATAAARALVRDGGAIVIAAQLEDGKGDAEPEPDRVFVVVAASESPEIVRLAGMRAAVDVEEGLDLAYEHIGRPTRASVRIVTRADQASRRP